MSPASRATAFTASATHDGRRFELIDTGGIVVSDAEYIPSQILKQASVALEQASHVIFLVDGRGEITGSDRELPPMLRKLGKPVIAGGQQSRYRRRRRPGPRFLFASASRTSFRFPPNTASAWTSCSITSPKASRSRRKPAEPEPNTNQSRDHRPPQRGQIDPAECADRRGAGHRFAHRRHHARCGG